MSGVVPGQADLESNYLGPLTNITRRLKQQLPTTKLLFAITSAYLCSVDTDDIVLHLNDQARTLMVAENIPTVDLHAAVSQRQLLSLSYFTDNVCVDHQQVWASP